MEREGKGERGGSEGEGKQAESIGEEGGKKTRRIAGLRAWDRRRGGARA